MSHTKALAFVQKIPRVVVLLLMVCMVCGRPLLAAPLGGEDLQSVVSDSTNYKTKSFSSCGTTTGTSGGEGLPDSVPAVWRNLIMGAAPQHPDADPRLVASVLWVENRGWPAYKTSGWSDSPSGAQGPWQFIASSWATMGQDGDGDGIKDPNNPKDAVHAAFIHMRTSAGKPVADDGYTGSDAQADFNTAVFHRNGNNLLSFAANYNGHGAPEGVALKNFPRGQNPDYVIMNYWLLATNFKQGFIFDKGLVDAATYNQAGSSTDSPSTGATGGFSNCSTVNGTVNTAGYSFPVAPQRKSQNSGVPGLSAIPCHTSSCHHDGTPAFDIGRQPGGDTSTGATVFAITSGTIKNLHQTDNLVGCYQFQLLADNPASNDHFWYWHGHTGNVKVQSEQHVVAGQAIAEIGERKCTGNGSSPHLHIDRGCIRNGEPQPGGFDSCRDPGMIPLINSLFEELPE